MWASAHRDPWARLTHSRPATYIAHPDLTDLADESDAEPDPLPDPFARPNLGRPNAGVGGQRAGNYAPQTVNARALDVIESSRALRGLFGACTLRCCRRPAHALLPHPSPPRAASLRKDMCAPAPAHAT